MATVINGKEFAVGLRERVAQAVSELNGQHNIKPGLAVVLVGEDPASQVYVRNKGKQTCLLYTSPSPRDATLSRMPSSA